jgi:hypothetical protein
MVTLHKKVTILLIRIYDISFHFIIGKEIEKKKKPEYKNF